MRKGSEKELKECMSDVRGDVLMKLKILSQTKSDQAQAIKNLLSAVT